MNTTRPAQSTDRLAVIATLSLLLQRLEASKVAVDADQYRTGLQALLDAPPAAAELYENLRCEHAGLCRLPLERSMATEAQARELIERAARGDSAAARD